MTISTNKRKRGVWLTNVGRHKLEIARSQQEREDNFGDRYTIEELSGITGLAPNTINKIIYQKGSVDRSTLDRYFTSFGSILDSNDYQYSPVLERDAAIGQIDRHPTVKTQSLDWGEAPDVSIFYGRDRELRHLATWIQTDRCRLAAILGMGGIGKTALVTKLAQQLQPQFTVVVWRSLRNARSLGNLLSDLIQVCSQGQEIAVPGSTISAQISQLLNHLNQRKCLLILDNVEAILQSGELSNAGNYQHNYTDYGEFFERLGTSSHQSSLLLTSREQPSSISYLAADNLPIRIFSLMGLDLVGSDRLFNTKGLSASIASRSRLVEIYAGNPLALKIVATTIAELFDGNIDQFLATETFIFDEIRQLLDQQFDRLSANEQIVMYWLAIERQLTPWQDLQAEVVPEIAKINLLETLKSLGRRCLIEQNQGKFTQQGVVIEYVTKRAIERVERELREWCIPLWCVETATLLGCDEDRIGWIWSLSFSPDGQLLATTGSSDRTVKLWDVATGDLIHTFSEYATEVSYVSFSTDGRQLAACSNNGLTHIWDIKSKEITQTNHNFEGSILSHSPDGQWLANCNAVVKFWNLTNNSIDRNLLKISPPYDRMNIRGVKGLNPATISSLKTLGAIDV